MRLVTASIPPLSAAFLALGLGAAQAEEKTPFIPDVPSPESVEALDNDGVKLAFSEARCIGHVIGPFKSEAEYQQYANAEAAYHGALTDRVSAIEDQIWTNANVDLAHYLELLINDPEIQTMDIDPKILLQTAIGFQIGFAQEYPQAVCSPSYFMGPFKSAQAFSKLDEVLASAEVLEAEGSNALLTQMLGLPEGTTMADLIELLDPDAIQRMLDNVADAESDGIITSLELMRLMRDRANLIKGVDEYTTTPSLQTIAENVLKRIGVDEPDSEHIDVLAQQILTASLALKAAQEMMPDVFENPFEGITERDLFDSMRDNTFGGDHDNVGPDEEHYHLDNGTPMLGPDPRLEEGNDDFTPPEDNKLLLDHG